MNSFKSFCFVAAALTISVAQAVQLTNSDYSGITAGQPFEISWSGDGTVSIFRETPVEMSFLC